MKTKQAFAPWKFGREIISLRGSTCSKCNGVIERGSIYRSRTDHSGYHYHISCVAFIASRYDGVVISDQTAEETELIRDFTLDIIEKIIGEKARIGEPIPC